jgi:hypothetical protein
MGTLKFNLILAFICLLFAGNIQSQDIPAQPTSVSNGGFMGVTPPLRDLPTLSAADFQLMKE